MPPATAPPDRSASLIGSLIDLADRVPSEALRVEIVGALARAGVQSIEVPAGTPFDAAMMRGVGSAPAPEPAAVGRVATTDRPGFRDGQRVIRLPDVVVYVAS